jgi:hypothetical protein
VLLLVGLHDGGEGDAVDHCWDGRQQ